uniref:NADH dehydrogenase [ubiquinone] iron-sulfur protein 4, mitochondrial n=1 Tax=Ixodes ricinus TaxID=34613 RepID=V5IK22_IXORI
MALRSLGIKFARLLQTCSPNSLQGTAVHEVSGIGADSQRRRWQIRKMQRKYSPIPLELQKKKEVTEALITVDTPMDIAPLTGVPEEHIKTRRVRTLRRRPATRCSPASTTPTPGGWSLTTANDWENPPDWAGARRETRLSNMNVDFSSKEAAMSFCEKNGWDYFVDEPAPRRSPRKNYGDNFSWNKRTRVSTK